MSKQKARNVPLASADVCGGGRLCEKLKECLRGTNTPPSQGFHYSLAEHQENRLAVRMILPSWFDHLEESFPFKEVQFK